MKRPLTLAVLSLAIVAGLAAVALRPGEIEQISMLERDGEIEAAARLANRLYDGGDRRSALLARVFELNHTLGNPQLADEALRAYLRGTPDSPQTLRKAADFFQLQQDLEGTLSALESWVKISPSFSGVERLARLYRLHGRFTQEEQLLLKQRHLLDADFMTRLGGLLAQKGDSAGALNVLRVADERFPGAHRQYGGLLFDLLVSGNALDEALRRSVGWARQDSDHQHRMSMILRFVEVGAKDHALELAGVPAAGEAPSGDLPRTAAIWLLLDRGYIDWAGALVERLDDTRYGRAGWSAASGYIAMAVATGGLGKVLTQTDRLLHTSSDQARRIGLSLAGILFDRWGSAGLGPLRGRLGSELPLRDPLFAAKLAAAEKRPQLAAFYLSAVELSEDNELLSRDWFALASEHFRPTDLAREMIQRREAGVLPSVLIGELQDSVRKSGLFMPRFDPFAAQRSTSEEGERSRGAGR
ncbi:tetratricopeptide repeat protein [Phreatobacter sp.]|uniref:tetratricopeptide repeat protein n=1 Tax=Phreatobacter sp. TaxID=1966341 RepID=UPI003F7133C9